MHEYGSQMPPLPPSGDKDPRRPQSQQQQQQQQQQPNGAAKAPVGGVPLKPPHIANVNGCTDVKPRLTKDQHDILEAHFQQQNKPSTSTKKGFAENLGVPIDKINVSDSSSRLTLGC